jgi:hypothetical protein
VAFLQPMIKSVDQNLLFFGRKVIHRVQNVRKISQLTVLSVKKLAYGAHLQGTSARKTNELRTIQRDADIIQNSCQSSKLPADSARPT